MKFSVNRIRLLEAVSLACSVIPVRTVKPVLQNLRMILESETMTLLATDLEMAVRCTVHVAEASEEGDLLLPAAKLIAILREADSDDVSCESDDFAFRIQSGRNHFRIMAESPEDFPVVERPGDAVPLVMPSSDFCKLIRKTSFATAKEKTRYAFNGVRFETGGGEARMVATDGRRLALMTVPIENPDGFEAGHVIPAKGLAVIERVLGDLDSDCEIFLQDRAIAIRSGPVEISSRLLDGAFPRYESVLPKDVRLTARFEKLPLLAALRQANVLTAEESRSIRISFENDLAVMNTRAMDVGESRIEIEAVLEGEPIEANFNGDFLIEGIKQMDAHQVIFKLSGRDTPTIIEGEENFLYLVMPVTVRTA